MRFLLLLALFFHAGPAEGTQLEDEMGTPNINTIIEWVRSEYPDLPRIQTTNCRPIAGSSTWSQHSWANAADIFPTSKAQGDEIKARLRERFDEWIATLLWQVRDHFDHIHVDMWPEGIFTPPCAGGKLVVAYENGDIGYVFTDDIPKGGDEMSQALRHQVVEAGAKTWLPTQAAIDYWMALTNDPTNPEWRDFEQMWAREKQKEYLAIKAATTGAVDSIARADAKRANDRLTSLDTKLANIVI